MKSNARPDTELCHRKAVERVIAAMRRSLDRTPSLEELAEIALMSPFHFSRTFHRVTGLPPLRFHAALRLEEAKRLLLFTDISVSALCFQLGYLSPGSFCMRFRNAVGLSPSGFRALAAEDTAWRLRLFEDPLSPPPDGPAVGLDSGEGSVWARIDGHVPSNGPIFAGLFPSALPEGQPVAYLLLEQTGELLFEQVPEGQYHLFAVTLDRAVDPKRALLYDGALRAGLPPGEPLVVRRGWGTGGPVGLTLGPPAPTAPPFLTAIPCLLRPAPAETEQLTSPPWLAPQRWACKESSVGC